MTSKAAVEAPRGVKVATQEEHNCTELEHQEHIAQALEVFYDEHGDYRYWTPEEWRWHDLLLQRVNKEDGY